MPRKSKGIGRARAGHCRPPNWQAGLGLGRATAPNNVSCTRLHCVYSVQTSLFHRDGLDSIYDGINKLTNLGTFGIASWLKVSLLSLPYG